RIQAIWSTYPIMTAHCIAHTLSAITHLPWIADFRDPVASERCADSRFAVASRSRWEQRVMKRASRIVVTTPGARQSCADAFPDIARGQRLAIIENGYDESDFSDLSVVPAATRSRPLVLLHSGWMYRYGRDP